MNRLKSKCQIPTKCAKKSVAKIESFWLVNGYPDAQ